MYMLSVQSAIEKKDIRTDAKPQHSSRTLRRKE